MNKKDQNQPNFLFHGESALLLHFIGTVYMIKMLRITYWLTKMRQIGERSGI